MPLLRVRQVQCVAPLRFSDNAGPQRLLRLPGGESVGVEFRGCSETDAVVRLFGKQVSVPLSSVREIASRAGAMTVLYDDCEGEPLAGGVRDESRQRSGKASLRMRAATDSRVEFHCPHAVQHGRAELCFFDSVATDATAGREIVVEFDFATKSGAVVTLAAVLGGAGEHYGLSAPAAWRFATQRVPRKRGWHHLRLLFDADRTWLAVDQSLLASGPSAPGPLVAVRCVTRGAPLTEEAADAGGDVWIDDVHVQEQVEMLLEPRADADQDRVWRRDGDEVFGTVCGGDAHAVRLRGMFGERSFPWSDVRQVCWGRRVQDGRTVEGLLVRIELRGPLGVVTEEREFLRGALRSADASALELAHPALGVLHIPWAEVRAVAPEFLGQRWDLGAGERHLGAEVRPEFRQPLPEGVRLSATVQLDAVPQDPVYVALTAVDLEPRGQQVPMESPLLADLIAGHLRSELLVNGQRVDDLNRHAQRRGTRERPERIRVPVPAQLWKVGANTVQIELRPARNDAGAFDDWELSQWELELERR